MCLSYLNNPMGEHSLGSWGEFFKFPKGDFKDYDRGWCDEMGEYVRRDTELTWKVFEHLYPKVMQDEALRWCYFNIDQPFIRAIIALEHNGIKVNKEAWNDIITELQPKLSELSESIKRLVPLAPAKLVKTKNPRSAESVCTTESLELGKFVFKEQKDDLYYYWKVEEYNPNSDDQTAWALAHLYGWQPEKFSEKTGKATVNKDVLTELPYDLANLLTQYSKLEKIVSTYGTSLLDKVKPDGRLYASFNQFVTLTGRLSSSNPNLQNIPSKGELGDSIRSMFVSSEGKSLVGIDIDAFQMRIFAWYLYNICQDTNLFNEFNTNEDADPHIVTANLLGVDRKVGKTMNFGNIFGIGAGKMSGQLGVSEKQAKAYLEKLNEKFPSIKKLKEYVWANTKSNRGYVYTLYGRRGYYPDIIKTDRSVSSRAERQSFNFTIQGTEADLIKLWINNLLPVLSEYGAKLVLQVHDEFIFEVEDSEAQCVADVLNEYINGFDWLPELRLKATAKIGKTWLEIH
jgi:DNA polymerase I-like protein with 3'-5' exonuclease and polymerase domains